MNNKIAKIDFKIADKKYKIISITRGSDKSIYVNFLVEASGYFTYSKFTYHPDGKSHIKCYSKSNKILRTIHFPNNIPISKIRGIVDTRLVASINDFPATLFKGVNFKYCEGKKDYKYYKIIDTDKYKSITWHFFLVEKGYDYSSKNVREYKEIIPVEQDDLILLITFENIWTKIKNGLETQHK